MIAKLAMRNDRNYVSLVCPGLASGTGVRYSIRLIVHYSEQLFISYFQ
ncbi:hypothetical protein D1BOALGB6SA_7149 [Olavius sp. associated proteobacterium Delta 1]|nr:hypothetical protein D1BOALGB6SA_7149 [Olavius sp. associated proteobacterium Delta 1]